jgi:hypothetical protein
LTKLAVVIGVPLFMLALGIALEITIFVSNKNDGSYSNLLGFESQQFIIDLGFEVPQSNVFTGISPEFLAVSCLHIAKLFCIPIAD